MGATTLGCIPLLRLVAEGLGRRLAQQSEGPPVRRLLPAGLSNAVYSICFGHMSEYEAACVCQGLLGKRTRLGMLVCRLTQVRPFAGRTSRAATEYGCNQSAQAVLCSCGHGSWHQLCSPGRWV